MKSISKAACLALLAAPALALGPSDGGDAVAAAAARRAAVIASLPRGSAFSSEGHRYRFLRGVHAISRGAAESEAQALMRARVGSDDLLEHKGTFVVFRDATAAVARVDAAAAAQPGAGFYTVAVNAATGRLGVVSGVINARLRKGRHPEAVARAHGLALIGAAPRIRAAFFQVPAGYDLQAAAAALARDSAVTSAELEVLEHVDVPQ